MMKVEENLYKRNNKKVDDIIDDEEENFFLVNNTQKQQDLLYNKMFGTTGSSSKKILFTLIVIIVFSISAFTIAMDDDSSPFLVKGASHHQQTLSLRRSSSPASMGEYSSRSTRPKKMELMINEPAINDEAAAAEDEMEEYGGGDEEGTSKMTKSVGTTTTSSKTTMGKNVLKSLENDSSPKRTRREDVTERMLVHTGDMSLLAYKENITILADSIEKIVKEVGQGYVESRSTNSEKYYDYNDEYYYSSEEKYRAKKTRINIHMQLRILSSKFHDIIKIIRNDLMGSNDEEDNMIISITTNSKDVTDEYIDSKSRSDTLDSSRNAIKVLLTKANTIKDVMNVQNELTRLTQQYESYKSRSEYLKKQASLSTLSIHIQEKIRKKMYSNNPTNKDWWNPLRSFNLALEHIGYVLIFTTDTIIYALVWLVPCAFLFGVTMLIIRQSSNRN